jgi:homoserine kinase
VAVGFDILGHSLEGPGDTVTVVRTNDGEIRMQSIAGCVASLPLNAAENTAGRALMSLVRELPGTVGFEVSIEKGIPLGSGLGGSAASAVAALVAANALLEKPFSTDDLYGFAMDGEAVASGARHGDNVAPMLLGGLVLAPSTGAPVKLRVPKNLFAVVVHPHVVLETRRARAALDGPYALHDFVEQSEGLALVLAGCWAGDVALIARGLKDVLVEPRRAKLIPGFPLVKAAALASGALGASISGAGPSVFAWTDGHERAVVAGNAMRQAFAGAGLESDVIVSLVDGPKARILSCDV